MHSDMKEKRKRIVTKIGDVFCAEIDGEFKAYFQYVANDLTQLNSSVIRVFKKRYPMNYVPVIEDIVKDEVLFYAHTVLRWGIEYNAWYKVGKSKEIGENEISKVIFAIADPHKYDPVNGPSFVDPLENWRIWHISGHAKNLGRLPQKYIDKVYISSVMNFASILECAKYGYYLGYDTMYSVLKRRPHPEADSYMKAESDGKTIYYHFKGEHAVREAVVASGNIMKLTSDNPQCAGERLRTEAFSDTIWRQDNFITRQEFEDVWNT